MQNSYPDGEVPERCFSKPSQNCRAQFLEDLRFWSQPSSDRESTRRTFGNCNRSDKSRGTATLRKVVTLLRNVQTWITFCKVCQYNCRPVLCSWISWKPEYGKPYFTTGVHKFIFVKVHTCCPIWVKFFIRNLHTLLFNICELWNSAREGCTFLTGVN